MQIGLSLKVKIQIDQSITYFIQRIFIKAIIHIARRPREVLQSARALRTAEIAGGSGLDRYIEGYAPLYRVAGPFGQIERR
jgi:hypothetical protein